jgi:hypothetical protein
MAVPVQLTTNVQNETFGGVTYHIEGELAPALHLDRPCIITWKVENKPTPFTICSRPDPVLK